MNEIKFTAFADLHYRKGMYIATVDDLRSIFRRAVNDNSDFVIHLGDMCNDYIGSPELIKAYIENESDKAVYGIYGNHELESANNSMAFVTPLLTNRNVIWGTEEGTIGDGYIGYYYFDTNGFRFVMTDTNYSYNPQKNVWEHNATCSYGPPNGNTHICALGPIQLKWLDNVLCDAAEKGLHCIVCSHTSFSKTWTHAPETNEVQEIFKKVNKIKQGTVLMSINGHLHSDHIALCDDVVYIDLNTVRNGVWLPSVDKHYTHETFQYTEYDEKGNEIDTKDRLISELWMSPQTWYFTDPVSATITVREDGKIAIEGMETNWLEGIIPPKDCMFPNEPIISSAVFVPLNER
ncbi:MAG: metallophosphoesterase [Clostridia bacterium]|nr:metallophosphoesterase [Clostridia bacterium]